MELHAWKIDVLLQEYEEPTTKLDSDAEQSPLLSTEMAPTEMEEMIKAEVSCLMEEAIDERLAEMMIAIIPPGAQHFFPILLVRPLNYVK